LFVAGRKDGAVAIVKARGRLGRDEVPELAGKVRETSGDDRFVVVNLSGVTEIVSAGIACLTELRDWCRREGGRLALAELSPNVAEILGITGLDALFVIMDTEAEAAEFLAEEAEEAEEAGKR